MWYDIDGHDEVAERFRHTLSTGRLAGTYLFVGPAGIGKRMFAEQLARSLLCKDGDVSQLEICNRCRSCQLARAGNHPDLLEVGLPSDKTTLPIELFIGDRGHRHQNGLCHHLSLKPSFGGRRIAIIDDADHLNQESANCLLKTLEEPPPRSVLILIGTSPGRQLPTIRSRSQLVRFQPLPLDTAARLLIENQTVETATEAARLAAASGGSLEWARELADPDLWVFQQRMARFLHKSPIDSVQLASDVLDFVNAAGKEASDRRQRLRFVLRTTAEKYRDQMLSDLSEATAERIDDCLKALELVDRNANQASLVHWWAQSLRGGHPRI